VDTMDSVDDLERYSSPPLMCLVEEENGGMGADERVWIGMIVISPSTGDVVWDEFEGIYFHLSRRITRADLVVDNHMRTELEVTYSISTRHLTS
jgi:DNA mismatch repair protein MSH3